MQDREKKIMAVKTAVNYADRIGDGGDEIASAIMAAYCAGLAAARKDRPTPEKPEQPKKEG